MNKKIYGIIGVIVILVLLIICCLLNPTDDVDSSNALTNAIEESENINENETKEFTDISVNDYLNMYNGEEKELVLVGRPGCQYCQIAEPILHNIAYKYDININYLNTDNFQDDDAKNFVASDEYFSEGFGTPMLLVVSNGKINDMVDGVTDTKHYTEFLKLNKFIE